MVVEPACERQRVGRVETVVTVVGSGGRVRGGFDSAVRFAHVLAQPALTRGFDSDCSFVAVRLNRLGGGMVVEPACERQRVGRVETGVRVSGEPAASGSATR